MLELRSSTVPCARVGTSLCFLPCRPTPPRARLLAKMLRPTRCTIGVDGPVGPSPAHQTRKLHSQNWRRAFIRCAGSTNPPGNSLDQNHTPKSQTHKDLIRFDLISWSYPPPTIDAVPQAEETNRETHTEEGTKEETVAYTGRQGDRETERQRRLWIERYCVTERRGGRRGSGERERGEQRSLALSLAARCCSVLTALEKDIYIEREGDADTARERRLRERDCRLTQRERERRRCTGEAPEGALSRSLSAIAVHSAAAARHTHTQTHTHTHTQREREKQMAPT